MASISEQIAQQYQSSLSRTPDSDGLNYWTNEVKAGRLTLDQAKNAIANSQEAKITKDLKDTYGTYLERDADAEGLQYWKDEVNTGNLSLDQAKIAIATSPDAKAVDPVKSTTAALYNTVLQRAPDEEGLNYFADEITTSLKSGVDSQTVLQNVATSLASSEERKIQNVTTINNLITRATEGDIGAYGEFLYLARKSDTPVQKELIEQIGYGTTDDKTAAYNYSVGAQAYAEGLEALDQARASGDTTKITELENQLANPSGFFDYYNETLAENEGQAQINLRKETAAGNPFTIGDPGEYQTTFLDELGDVAQDFLETPVFKMAIALNPYTRPFAPFISAVTTKLSGDEISGLQVAGMIASAPGAFEQSSNLLGLESGAGMFSPGAIDDFYLNVGNEQNWFDIGENISSGITTQDDLLRGAQQGAVSGAATALSGGSDIDILKAIADKQNVTIPLTGVTLGEVGGMLSGIEIPGLNIPIGDLPSYTIPGLNIPLGELENYNIPGLNLSLGEIGTIAGNFPDLNIPIGNVPFDVNIPEFAANFGDLSLGDFNIPDINLSLPEIPNQPFETQPFEIGQYDLGDYNFDINLPNFRFRLPQVSGIDPMSIGSNVLRGGRGMFGSDDEDIKRISELLLAGLPAIGAPTS